jgi:hypothetical protein
MKRLLVLCLLGSPASFYAADFCERDPTIDPEFPAGLGGSYEIVGKDPLTGSAYAGSLIVDYGKSTYSLTRSVQDGKVHGDAWIERCGADKIVVLIARHYTKPAPLDLRCSLGADGGNYYRTTCRTRYLGSLHWSGLEAWFQAQE